MPKRKFNRRNKKRRFRNRKKKTTSMVIRGSPIIPDRTFVRLKYFIESKSLCSAQPARQLLMSGNGAYDPEVALGGHSPMGYDQWAQLYQNYRVHKSKITIIPTNTDVAFNWSLTPSTITGVPETTALAKESAYTRYKTVGSLAQYRFAGISNSMMSKKLIGLKSISQLPEMQAGVGAVPQGEWFWVLNISSGTGGNLNLFGSVYVEYWVEFFNRKEIPQSGIIGDGISVNNQDTPFGQTGPTGPGSVFGGSTGGRPGTDIWGHTGGHG